MQTAKNRIIETSRRDFKVNKLLFVITNLVLFMNFIMQMSHESSSPTTSKAKRTIMRAMPLHMYVLRR